MNSNIPETWKRKKFSEIANIGSGQISPQDDPYSDYLHIGPGNVSSDTGRIHDLKKARQLGLSSGKYFFDGEAIIYSKIRPNLNKVCLPSFVGICSADMYPIWPERSIERKYLYYFMLSDLFLRQSVPVSARTGIPKINRNDLNKIEVLVPPIEEQQKITRILSVWDEYIAKTEDLIATLEQRKKGLMQRLLTGEVRFSGYSDNWKKLKLGDVCKRIKGKVIETNNEEKGLPYIGSTSFQGEFSDYSLDEKGIRCFPDDVLILWDGEYAGKSTTGLNGYASSTVVILRIKKNIMNNIFLQALLDFFEPYIRQIREGSGIPHLPKDLLGHLEITIPSLKEQNKISRVITLCDKELDLYQQKRKLLQKQKKGLIQRLMTGRVRVKVEE